MRPLEPICRQVGCSDADLERSTFSVKSTTFVLPRICASGIDDDGKKAIKELVKHMGGKYTNKMSRSNTHLIIQKAMGEKWRHAADYGVAAVTQDWLVQSAVAGEQNIILPLCKSRYHDIVGAIWPVVLYITESYVQANSSLRATMHRQSQLLESWN